MELDNERLVTVLELDIALIADVLVLLTDRLELLTIGIAGKLELGSPSEEIILVAVGIELLVILVGMLLIKGCKVAVVVEIG